MIWKAFNSESASVKNEYCLPLNFFLSFQLCFQKKSFMWPLYCKRQFWQRLHRDLLDLELKLPPLFSRVFPSVDQPSPNNQGIPLAANTGSLPDLSILHFQSPLPTPIDSEDGPLGQLMSSTQQYVNSPLRPQHMRRHTHGNPQTCKPGYSRQSPMDPNLSPLESRLQQFQFYPQQNAMPNSEFGKMVSCNSTGASPTLSPTSSPMTPLFNSLPPNSPLSPLAAEMYLKQQQTTAALQQQLEQFSMHGSGNMGSPNSMNQMPFQSIFSQGQCTFSPSMASLGQFYANQGNRVPDLVITGTEDDMPKSDFAREISNAMASVGTVDSGDGYSDDPLKLVLDPLDMQMLSGHDTEVADVATEDSFRMDRIGWVMLGGGGGGTLLLLGSKLVKGDVSTIIPTTPKSSSRRFIFHQKSVCFE